MPTLISSDNAAMTPSQRATHEAAVRADAAKYGVDLKQFGTSQQPAKPAGTPEQVTALEQGLSRAPTIQSMSAQAAKQVADQLVASQLFVAEQKNGAPLSYTEKQALETQLRGKVARALAIDGHAAPAAPIDPELAQLHRTTGVPANTEPAVYDLDLNRPELPADRQLNARAVAAKWASELQLEPHLASNIISHISETTTNLQKYTDDQRVKWTARQSESLLRACNGSAAGVEALIAKAHKVLAMSGTIQGQFGAEQFSAALKDNLIGKSAFLIRTLAAQADALDLLEKGKKHL